MFRKRKEDNVEIRQTKRKVKTELRCRCKTKAPAEKEMREKSLNHSNQQPEKPERIHSIPFKTQPATQGKFSHISPPD